MNREQAPRPGFSRMRGGRGGVTGLEDGILSPQGGSGGRGQRTFRDWAMYPTAHVRGGSGRPAGPEWLGGGKNVRTRLPRAKLPTGREGEENWRHEQHGELEKIFTASLVRVEWYWREIREVLDFGKRINSPAGG